MSSAAAWALVLLLAVEAPPPDATPPAAAADGSASATGPDETPPPHGRPRRDRSVGDELPLAPGADGRVTGEPWRPAQLVPRSPVVAATLGGVVGFGSGLHYAGEPVPGVAFGVADGALLIGLAVLEVVLNRDVLQRDFEVGLSLGRGQRSMTGHEKTLYGAAWATGGVLAVSHVAQALLGYQAARRYDATLGQVSCVPLSGDAGPR